MVQAALLHLCIRIVYNGYSACTRYMDHPKAFNLIDHLKTCDYYIMLYHEHLSLFVQYNAHGATHLYLLRCLKSIASTANNSKVKIIKNKMYARRTRSFFHSKNPI